jgi:hypothetical protein
MFEKQRFPVPVQLAATLAAMRPTSDWNRPLARALALRSGERLLTLREAAELSHTRLPPVRGRSLLEPAFQMYDVALGLMAVAAIVIATMVWWSEWS